MDIFKQRKILITALVVLGLCNLLLVAVNLALIGFFGMGKKQERKEQDKAKIAQVLKEKLGLNDNQTAQFQNIRDGFFQKEEAISAVIKNCRDSMNSQMYSRNANDSSLKKLAETVAAKELEMEMLRIEQARQIRAICTPEQLDKFNTLVREIRDYLKPDDKKK